MSQPLQTVLDFVEGRIDARQFEAELYSKSSDFERLLNQDPNLPAHNYASPSTYLFVVRQDFSDPGGVLCVHGALSQYLQRNDIASHPTTVYGDFFRLLLEAQPDWLNVDMKYLQALVENSEGRTGDELKQWLQAELLKRFCYLASPPDWIQDAPEWPMSNDVPLFFLGQMDIERYFHDIAAAYVFYDRKSGTCETLIQVA